MIYKLSHFLVLDNSGALEAQLIGCIKKLKYAASVGNMIIVSIKRAVKYKKLKPGDVKQALIVQTRKQVSRYKRGYSLSFDSNQVIIMNKFDTPCANRLKGTITQELKKAKQLRVLAMSTYII